MSDDWSDNLDDRDASYWEAYFDGPDPEDLEVLELRRLESFWEEEDRRDQERLTDLDADRKEYDLEDSDRRVAVVTWLASSKLARPLDRGDGFLIPQGRHVRMGDGTVIEVVDWLEKEGVRPGDAIGDYSVIRSHSRGVLANGVILFRIVDAPFFAGTSALPFALAAGSKSDDIPF